MTDREDLAYVALSNDDITGAATAYSFEPDDSGNYWRLTVDRSSWPWTSVWAYVPAAQVATWAPWNDAIPVLNDGSSWTDSPAVMGTASPSVPLPLVSAWAYTGTADIDAGAAMTTPLPTIAASGSLHYTGTASMNVPLPTIAASGVDLTHGTAAMTTPLPVVAAYAITTDEVPEVIGGVHLNVPLPEVAAGGLARHTGTAALTTPLPVMLAEGSTTEGVAAMTTPLPVAVAGGVVTVAT